MNTSPQNVSESRPFMSDDIGKIVQIHPLNLDHYLLEDIYAKVDQIGDPNKSLHDIHETICCALAESFCNYNYGYVRGMITVYESSTVILRVRHT